MNAKIRDALRKLEVAAKAQDELSIAFRELDWVVTADACEQTARDLRNRAESIKHAHRNKQRR